MMEEEEASLAHKHNHTQCSANKISLGPHTLLANIIGRGEIEIREKIYLCPWLQNSHCIRI